jgi:predicted phage tail protein
VEGTGRGVPGQVTGASIEVKAEGAILSWVGFETDGGDPISSIRIYMGPDPGEGSLIAEIPPDSTEFEYNGLINGGTYFFWISGLNKYGEGSPSIPLQVVPGRAPGIINDVTLRADLESVRIDWSAPEDTGGRDLLEYVIYRGSSKWTLKEIFRNVSSSTIYIDEGLSPQRSYVYSVSAINRFGEGPLSDPVETTTFGRASSPRILEYFIQPSSVDLEWTASEDDGGSSIIGYVVEYKATVEKDWNRIDFKGTQGEVGGLQPGRIYYFRVRAETLISLGDPSQEISTIVGNVPEPPSSVSFKKEGNNIRVEWSLSQVWDPEITSFRIYMAVDGGRLNLLDEVDAERSNYLVRDMLMGRTYTFSISCKNAIGEGDMSVNRTILLTGLPSPPDIIWVEKGDPSTVRLRWYSPEYNAGTPVTEYEILRGTSDVSLDPVGKVTRNAFDDESVEPGNSYYYQIRTINVNGKSETSKTIEASTKTTPSSPTDLKVETATDNVLLTWDPPVSDGGYEISAYHVYRSKDGGETELVKVLGADSRGFKDETVSSGLYTYDVAAVNRMGVGDTSTIDADVPSRILLAAVAFILALSIPLLILFAIAFLPGYLRKRRERMEREEEESRRRRELEGVSGHRLPKLSVPAIGAAPNGASGMKHLPPPAAPKVDETTTGEGYIRPSDMKKKKKDRKAVLRADGKSIRERETEKHLTELKSNGKEVHEKYKEEMEEALKKEAESVFTGQQLEGPAPPEIEGGFKAAPAPSMRPQPLDDDENIPTWNDQDDSDVKREEYVEDVPMAEPPDGKDEEIEEIEELEELEEDQ